MRSGRTDRTVSVFNRVKWIEQCLLFISVESKSHFRELEKNLISLKSGQGRYYENLCEESGSGG